DRRSKKSDLETPGERDIDPFRLKERVKERRPERCVDGKIELAREVPVSVARRGDGTGAIQALVGVKIRRGVLPEQQGDTRRRIGAKAHPVKCQQDGCKSEKNGLRMP